MQQPVYVSDKDGMKVVGGVMRCLWCRKVYVAVAGDVHVPSWILEVEKLEADKRVEMERLKAVAQARQERGVEADMRW